MTLPFFASRSAPAAVALFLDTYTGAAIAYSTRKLRNAYAGSALRVRRASDNAEQDIGFVSGNLDTASLATFCAGTNGFVSKWYDQSGNGNNLAQTTASNQPQISISGTTIVDGTYAALSFDGTNDSLPLTSTVNSAYPWTGIHVFRRVLTSDQSSGLGGPGGTNALRFDTTAVYAAAKANYSFYNIATVGRLLSTIITTSGAEKVYLNTTDQGASGHTVYGGGTNFDAVGLNSVTKYHLGKMQECILWASDQSSNRAGIESAVNAYFGIY